MNKEIISQMENKILKLRRYSAVSLSRNLKSLQNLRKEFYENTSDRESFIQEYQDYCNFNYQLLTTKPMSNVLYCGIVKNMLMSYDDVKPFDLEKTAFDAATHCLKSLAINLIENKGIRYRLVAVTRANNQFVKLNSQTEEHTNEESINKEYLNDTIPKEEPNDNISDKDICNYMFDDSFDSVDKDCM